MSGVRIVALVLSAVTVVTISAPRTASAALAARMILRSFRPDRLRISLSVAAGSISNARISFTPSIALNASTWNSLCAPLPINAIDLDAGRASAFATSADVAAVRNAVMIVNSLNSTGKPDSTSASTPNAITVSMLTCVFFGWPLTYLNPYSVLSEVGISSITPPGT
jgi:hypothetical protein